MRGLFCGIAAALAIGGLASSAAAQNAGWQKTWDETLVAAKREGKVVVVGSPDPVMRAEIIPRFQKQYGIQVEFMAGSSGPTIGRVKTERSSGIYAVDVYLTGSTTTVSVIYPAKLLDPLKPTLIRPEITEGKYWKRGEPWFLDPEKQYILLLFASVDGHLMINTDFVKLEELRSSEDLLNPKWRGKIAAEDPTGTGSGNGSAVHFLIQRGPEYVKQLYLDQKTVFSRDRRQLADWLARGTYPICIACRADDTARIKAEGFKIEEVFSFSDILNRTNASPFTLSVANRAPNPNAAKVFINWIAGKEALEIYSRDAGNATMRTDVDESFLDPKVVPKSGVKYEDNTTFEWLSTGRPTVAEQVRQLLKQK